MLSFAHPAILAGGLACVAVPILVHLLTRRRRTVVRWGAMRFLLEAYRRQRRRLRMEQWLLLAARCVLVALIGAAIAKPLLNDGAGVAGGAQTVVLAIDNGLTSTAVDGSGVSGLERLKAEASRVLSGLDAARGDRAGLIALGGPASALVMPPSGDLASVMRLVEELEAVDSRADVAGAVSEVSALAGSWAGGLTLMLMSEWRAGSVVRDAAMSRLPENVRVVMSRPTGVEVGNVTVERAEAPRSVMVPGLADASNPVRVRLRRSGEGVGISRVRAVLEPFGGGDVIDVGDVTVTWATAQSEADASIVLRAGALDAVRAGGVLRVEVDRDALDGDNAWRVPMEVREALRVGVVAPARFGRQVGVARFEAADWVRLALDPAGGEGGGSGLEVVEVLPGSLDRARLSSLDAAVVVRPDLVERGGWEALAEVSRRGGAVLVVVPAEASVHGWGDGFVESFDVGWRLGREPREIVPASGVARATAEGVGGDVAGSLLEVIEGELPFLVESVRVSRVLPVEAEAGDVVLRAAGGEPILVVGHGEGVRGVVGLLATGLDGAWTDLQAKPLMVPLVQEFVRQGVSRGSRGVVLEAGASSTRVGAEVTELMAVDARRDGARVSVRDGAALRHGGVWRAVDEDGGLRGLVVVQAAVGAGDVGLVSEGEVMEWLGGLSAAGVVFAGDEGLSGWLGAAEPGEPLAEASDARSADRRGAGIGWMLMIAAAGLGLVEMFAARAASHATVRGGGA